MTRCLVMDIETRLDRMALAASGRVSAPRDMPTPLQTVTAVAALEFERDASGVASRFRMTAHEVGDGREADVAAFAERELARAYSDGGELVTFNGGHDLGVLRFALLRARILGADGVRRWVDAPPARHRDLMVEAAGDGRWPRLGDAAAGLGFAPPSMCRVADEAGGARAKAEVDVALTALLGIHLEGERHGDAAAMARSLLSFGRFLAARASSAPHLAGILASRLYASASRTLGPAAR